MIFKTNDTKLKQYNGLGLDIIKKITTPDSTHDLEVLPMYKIILSNGIKLECWPDEIDNN